MCFIKTQGVVRDKINFIIKLKQFLFFQKQESEKVVLRPMAKITHKGVIAINEDLSDMAANISNNNNQVCIYFFIGTLVMLVKKNRVVRLI